MEQIRLQGAQQTTANEQLAAQVAGIQDRPDNPFRGNFTGPPQHLVVAESWLFSSPPNTDPDRAIAVRECAEMVQQALQNRVAPAMGAAFGALAADGSANLRVDTLEAEVRSLKRHTAWTQRDILTSQIEQAKRTIVCRNFPRWLSIQDGEVTIEQALTEAGLRIEGRLQPWELTTQRLVDDDGKESWSGVSILTVPNHMIRQKALQAYNRIRPRYVEKSVLSLSSQNPVYNQHGNKVREVERAKFLGIFLSRNGTTRKDVTERLRKARKHFNTLRHVWRHTGFPLH